MRISRIKLFTLPISLSFLCLSTIATIVINSKSHTLALLNLLLFLAVVGLFSLLAVKDRESRQKILKNYKKNLRKLRKLNLPLQAQLLSQQEEIKFLEEEKERILEERNFFEREALHDPITKLPNRTFLIEKIDFLIKLCKKLPSVKFYVLFIDLLRFKNINDYLGNTIGDRVLALVATRIKRAVGVEDMVARLGGDEFAVIISDPLSIERTYEIAMSIYKSITSSPFLIRKHRIELKLHIGLAAYDHSHEGPEDILRDADIAMHYAKEKGLPVAFFDENLKNQFLESAEIERNLRYALKENQFLLFYQPIICLKSGELVGFEALLRWLHPEKGFIPPSKFIPIAEDSGLIIPMTDWILTEACSQIAKWERIKSNLTISVNISGKHFAMETLPEEVNRIIRKTGINANNLKLELTETSAMENPTLSMSLLKDLRKLGVRLSIDDFGTGYSSLSQLCYLPFDSIKIDRSFVSLISKEDEKPEILKAIITLGKNLGMTLVAEGIETKEQLKVLRSMGCDYGQGYFIAKPMPKEEVEKNLLSQKNLYQLVTLH
ncbi:MAG: bifunctional diguanylate cyclase/phosphodiesterase [Pyrinomonadaceae bacterium]|nr:bifunctional diguanylate cyclase/phosphodiesterase [Pyrinomonadaceae bacterium]MCX7640119.1 bifunctional diguanylate cyclase/phosphodiesterase [Pyrinomonadaceae bacterium]MDW8303293.1 bifunctional diguanylate cyclase/phosphodiesterase [Acidobacteriota bacterium]